MPSHALLSVLSSSRREPKLEPANLHLWLNRTTTSLTSSAPKKRDKFLVFFGAAGIDEMHWNARNQLIQV
jgi:hypothetical protein